MGNFTITAEAGGPSTSGGSAPLAPNVTSAWLSAITPIYIAYGNAWKVAGFQGTLTPPSGTDCTYLRQIHIAAINPSGFRTETSLYGSFSVGVGKAFKVETDDLLTANATYTLEFASENDDSVITTPPYTTTVNVVAPSITSVSATDNVGSRYRYGLNSIRTVLSFTPTISNGQYPLTVTAWRNEGTGQKWCGWFVVASNGATVQIGAQGSPSEGDIIPPTVSNGSWTLTLAVGAIEKNATIPASAVTSSAFTVITPPAPSATAATGAYIDQVTYVKGAAGAYTFGWSHLYATLPLSDPNFMFARLTLQTGSGTGGSFVPGGKHAVETSIGDWAADDDHQDNFFRVSGTSQIYCFNPNLWDVPTDGNLTHRFKWYVASRKDDGTGATKVVQSCWSSGVTVSTPGTNAFQEFVADATKRTTDAALIDPTTLDPTLVQKTGGRLGANTSNSANIALNPSFENGMTGWEVYPGRGSLTTHVETGLSPSSGATISGSSRLAAIPDGSGQVAIREIVGHACKPGEQYYLDVWAFPAGNSAGAIALYAEIMDETDTNRVTAILCQLVNRSAMGGWTQLVGTVTIPANGSYIRVFVDSTGIPSGQYNLYDSATLKLQVTTGTGMESDGAGGVRWRTGGKGLQVNGSNQAEVKIAGPIYTDVADAVNIRISSDYVVSGGVLTQNIIDLAKSVNFSTEFVKSGGLMTINAIAVNKLIAGDALFAGQATFAYNGGGKVTINSVGLTLANHNSAPTSTVTITSTGITVARSTNSVQIDANGVGIYGPSGSQVVITSAGVTISKGILQSPTIIITNGATTINIDGTNLIMISNSSITRRALASYNSFRIENTSDSSQFSQIFGFAFSAQRFTGVAYQSVTLAPNQFKMEGLLAFYPGAGTKEFWYDPADGNRVKFAS